MRRRAPRREPRRPVGPERSASPRRHEEGSGILARLRARGLHPRKALGQHFLHDPKLLAALAEEAGVNASDRVLEVGTGPGTLTRELASRAERVLTLDVDSRMLAFARDELRGFENVTFLSCDALEGKSRISSEAVAALREIAPFAWVSNLPYGIATTLIVALCESGLEWTRAALLVQLEVADRLVARPGDDAFGAVSLLVAFWASARAGRKVPPGAFWPPPAVDSRVVHLERRAPLGRVEDYEAYRAWARFLFLSRRKQLGGALRRAVGEAEAARFLQRTGWSPTSRAENLGPGDLLQLATEFPVFSR
jgi:16S rRNA (adenine1518-N6/adenine1519-N6)-dimethyltransferase